MSTNSSVYAVTRTAVRHFLLEAQCLYPFQPSPTINMSIADQALRMIRHLECVQIDPVAAVERNQHLVLAARIPDYHPEALYHLLQDQHVFEYFANAACIIPMTDYPLFEHVRRRYHSRLQPELDNISDVVQSVLERLATESPLPSRAFQSTKRVHGYWDNKLPKTKATSLALNLLMDAGVIRVVHREGNERYFALATKSVPEQLLQQSKEIGELEGKEAILDKYLRAYRIFDYRDSRFGWRKMTAAERKQEMANRVKAGTIVPLQIEGVKTEYFILAQDLERLQEHKLRVQQEDKLLTRKAEPDEPGAERIVHDAPIRFLPPLDNLLWRRERIEDLFRFTYKWEIYTPAVKRQYGYYTMPILAGDQLIGRIDPKLDREKQHLSILLLQLESDVRFTPQLQRRLREALEQFAQFHGAVTYTVESTMPAELRKKLN